MGRRQNKKTLNIKKTKMIPPESRDSTLARSEKPNTEDEEVMDLKKQDGQEKQPNKSCISSPAVAVHNPTRSQHPVSVRSGKPTLTSLMHPFQWCNGCFCGLGLVSTNKSCSMPPISFQDLPLNIYMVIFGTGIFVFMLSLIFCCYFISKLRNQAQSERYGYKEVVLKGDAKKLQLYGVTCVQTEGIHPGRCLVKWLEVRCVCPMCNKPIAGPTETSQSIGILLDELV
ncbi:RING finger protein [Cricetulus griseus]|uniref:RING finger protein n=1 Tax=Cricetulus griseus TaxID=10029 RepID=A0A061IRD5_CRIGR|nr:RING finger protein [Cricetulus griseus]